MEPGSCFWPWWKVLCQFILMPLISFGIALLLGVTKEQGISMLVVGCSPGGSTSNLVVKLKNQHEFSLTYIEAWWRLFWLASRSDANFLAGCGVNPQATSSPTILGPICPYPFWRRVCRRCCLLAWCHCVCSSTAGLLQMRAWLFHWPVWSHLCHWQGGSGTRNGRKIWLCKETWEQSTPPSNCKRRAMSVCLNASCDMSWGSWEIFHSHPSL